MAADQYLLEHTDETAEATFRIYGWEVPTVSLGYFQSHQDRPLHPSSLDLAWVRRATGGGAIVHHFELTYSLALPTPTGARGELRSLYQQTHTAIIRALSDLGVHAAFYGEPPCNTDGGKRCIDPFLCFQRRTREDLIVDGFKIAGSAQRRGRRSILQHGSVLWATSPHAPELPGVQTLAAKNLSLTDLTESLVKQMENFFSFGARIVRWTNDDTLRINQIAADRFLQIPWNFRK